jgi:hypothetical protein
LPEAIGHYGQVLRIEPDYVEAQTALARLQVRQSAELDENAVFRENTALTALGSSNRNVRESQHSGVNLPGPFLS